MKDVQRGPFLSSCEAAGFAPVAFCLHGHIKRILKGLFLCVAYEDTQTLEMRRNML